MKKFFCLLIVCLLCTLFCSCAGLGDWTYEVNDSYVIGHLGPADNHLMHMEEGHWTTVVGALIFEFQHNDRFIGVNNGYYYLVDMDTHQKYGPFETIEEYTEQCALLGVGELGEWIETKNF